MSTRTSASAIALLAAAGLILEIALTRLASLLYFSPFVYVLLAVAVLGLGLGAAVAALAPATRGPGSPAVAAVGASLAATAVTLLTLALATLPLRWLALALLTLPYAFLGHTFASLFARRGVATERLYLADLMGAGAGALVAVPLINILDPIGACFTAAALAAGAAWLLRPPRGLLGQASLFALAVAVLVTVAHALGAIDAPLRTMRSPKPLQAELRAGATPLLRHWGSFGRSDLIRRPDGSLYLYLDGGAGSMVPDLAAPSAWLHDVGAFPFAALRPSSVFVIGPGGGLDVALARHFGLSDITAVELNAAALRLVDNAAQRGWLAGGSPYAAPVEQIVDEGRSVLRRSQRRYDLVLLSHVATDAAEARTFAMAENTVYTVESLRGALDHLTPGGALALKLYDELTLTRAMTTAITAIAGRGAEAGDAEASDVNTSTADAARHLFALLDTRQGRPVPLLMVFDHPLAAQESVALARLAEAAGLKLLFAPGLLANPPLQRLLDGQGTVAELVAASPAADIAPVWDARPFFFEFQPGIPRSLRPLLWTLAIAGLLLVPALAWRQRDRPTAVRAAPLLFGLLGVGFMLLEIDVLRRLQLYLGHPTLGLAVGLGALLVGAGLGAGWSGRGARAAAPAWRRAASAAALIVLVALVWDEVAPIVLDATLRQPSFARAWIAALLVLPLAFPLGIPFPSGLRAIAAHGSNEVALAWAVNGFASVLGSVAATALALLWGYGSVHAAGVACYLLAAGTAALSARSETRAPTIAATPTTNG